MEDEARRMVREGLGWEDLRVRLGISERDARVFVFGKAATRGWRRRMEMRKAS